MWFRNWRKTWLLSSDRNNVNPNGLCAQSVTWTWHVSGSTSWHILPAFERTVEQTKQTNKQTNRHATRPFSKFQFFFFFYNLRSFHTVHINLKLIAVLFLQCPLWILDRTVMWHRENCGYVRITGCGEKNTVTNFLEQFSNGSRSASPISRGTTRDRWEPAGFPRATPQHLAVRIMMGNRLHESSDRRLISRLLDTFLHSIRTGSGVHAAH
jgi:hypothetical protein